MENVHVSHLPSTVQASQMNRLRNIVRRIGKDKQERRAAGTKVFVTRTVSQEPRVGADLVDTSEFRFRAHSKGNTTIRVLGGRVAPAETCGLLSKHTEAI